MLLDLGLTVGRNVPAETWAGLASGLYRLHGGVVRDLSGRIVTHLALPASLLGTAVPGLNIFGAVVQGAAVFGLSKDIKHLQLTADHILTASLATTALSGLGLVVSIAGFAFLHHQIKQVESRLVRIEKQTREIKQILNSSHRAQLLAAIDSLSQSRVVKHGRMRHDLLMQGKQSFTTLAHHYKALWAEGTDMVDLDATDEHFTLAIMGAAICASDLGMGDIAAVEVKRHIDDWRVIAQRHCGKTLLKDDPERLLHSRYLKPLPTSEIVAMLDFVNGTQRGIGWVDELRARQGRATIFALPTANTETAAIDFARKLRARDEVLQGYAAHFEFLAPKKIKASDFTSEITTLLERGGDAALWITEVAPTA